MKKKVAFICVHNSCRSQIAEALSKKYGSDILDVYSAGTELKERINQDAVRIIKEVYGINMEITQTPKLIKDIPEVYIIITMGCNVVCPVLPYNYYTEDWGLEDPSGKSDEVFKAITEEIENKVLNLIERIRQGILDF